MVTALRAHLAPRIVLALIVSLAAFIRFAALDLLGYANRYYTAGVASMLQSWHNFYFVAAEPGGSVSIDKPPLGLWIQAVSAWFLGVNGFAVVLPEIVCGLLSLVVLYHLVGDRFGPAAGLLASLAMAITPVVVATDRNNTMDSSLILVLLLAAWAFARASETGGRRLLLLGAVLVGLAFNIKMFQAYLVLPALYLLYFVGAPVRPRRKFADLALATVVLVAVSLSWAVTVDLTPADQRPHVGSSASNSELDLMLGYNGLSRLTGPATDIASFIRRLTGGTGFATLPPAGNLQELGPGAPQKPPTGAFPPADQPALDQPLASGPPDALGGLPRGGPSAIGQPGILRLVSGPLSKEVSWFLPFALAGAASLAVAARPRWPASPAHQALALWGGWLLVTGVFFSVASFFHEYYLSMLAPAVAALTGIGVAQLWRLSATRRRLATTAFLFSAGCTLALQWMTSHASAGAGGNPWEVVVAALFGAGAIALVASVALRRKSLAAAAFTLVVAAMLVTPGVWSWLTATNPNGSQTLPSAYSRDPANPPPAPMGRGGLQVNRDLLTFLQARTGNSKYLMAVLSSMQGADYVLATGRPVLYVGGFNGQDRVVSAEGLSQMTASGELRYIYWEVAVGRSTTAAPGTAGARPDISAWLVATCRVATGYINAPVAPVDAANQPPGRLPGDGPGAAAPFPRQLTLYDCAR